MLSEKGATLMELVVVVAVAAIVVGALVFATIASLRNAQFSKNQSQATKLAQEGIERVRAGRDRNALISSMPSSPPDCPVLNSWNGQSSGSIWGCKIHSTCASGVAGTACYFKFNNAGILTSLGGRSTFPDTAAEQIPPLPAIGIFKRAIILSDVAATYNSQKTVTVIVSWTDFSGSHESRLTTILRKI